MSRSVLTRRERNTVNPAAVLPQPPPSLPLWAKAIYYLVETALVTYAASQYDYADQISAVGGQADDITAGSWRLFACHWENLVSGDPADDQVFTLEVMNITDGHLDGTWNDDDYNSVVGQIEIFLGHVASNTSSTFHANRIDAYIRGYNPYSEPKPFAHSGPPEKSYGTSHFGAMASQVPPQGACSITELTPSRPHWGRFYTPTLGTGAYATDGRVAAATVDALANAAHDMYETLMQNQFFPVVATTMSGGSKGVQGKPTRVLSTITGIRVDDVGDVIRRRRYNKPVLKTTLPLPADEPAQQPAA